MPSEDKLLENLGALCNMVRRIAIDAGEITLKYFEDVDAMQVDTKNDDSPVTLADREAEGFIQMSLEQLTPNIPMIGEEAAALGKLPDIQSSEYFWLVDPLDGTKEFVSGGGEFTVNIALIRNHEPVMGVVYVPYQGVLYAGHSVGSAIKWNEETDKEKQISVRPVPKGGMTVVASKSHGSKEKRDEFLEGFKVEKVVKRGSSLKICVIAEGKADMYPRFGPTCEWDTAAGHAVLRAAGGVLTDFDGQNLRYGGFRPRFLNPEFVACSYKWFEDAEDAV